MDCGITAPLSATGRYRAFAAATLLLAILCGSVIGWPRTVAAGALALWLAAIRGRKPARSAQSAHRSLIERVWSLTSLVAGQGIPLCSDRP